MTRQVISIFIALLLLPVSLAAQWALQVSDVAFDFSHRRKTIISPLMASHRAWRLCALYPHMKDSYWISVNYGMVDQSRRLKVNLKVLTADGYDDNEQQAEQLREFARLGTEVTVVDWFNRSQESFFVKL